MCRPRRPDRRSGTSNRQARGVAAAGERVVRPSLRADAQAARPARARVVRRTSLAVVAEAAAVAVASRAVAGAAVR